MDLLPTSHLHVQCEQDSYGRDCVALPVLNYRIGKICYHDGGKEGYFAVMTMDFSLEKAHIKTRLTYKKKQKFVSTLSSYIYPAFYTT